MRNARSSVKGIEALSSVECINFLMRGAAAPYVNDFLYDVVFYVQPMGFTLKNNVFVDCFKPVYTFCYTVDFLV